MNPTNQTVTICTPMNGATGLISPVHVNAGTTDTHPIATMWIYVDTVKVFAINNVNFIDTHISMSAGTHRFVVQAQDTSGLIFKTVETVTVGTNVVVSPSAVTLNEGATQHFTANVAVTWSASCGTIDSGGLYTAPNEVGTCEVTATDGTGHTGVANVMVVSSVVITPGSVTLIEGAMQQFTASTMVTWSASCGTIDVNGMYIAPNSTGHCVVTATDGSGKTGMADVTVAASVVVTPGTATLQVSTAQQFTANVTVSWSASCGMIDVHGLYTAPDSPTACTVTAIDNVSHMGTASVTVVATMSASGYLSWKNDKGATGQQRNETVLTPSNVNSRQFGKKFSESLDGNVFAQPLYVADLSIHGGLHNVVFVATEHNSVYAFDADFGGPALWHVSFLSSSVTTVPTRNVGSTITPEVGITGTPVIDPNTGTLFVVAETLENGGTKYVHRLHALDIQNGRERPGSPVVISGSVFTSKTQLQRGGLLLENGLVYITFASQGDHGLWQGYVFAYHASSLSQAALFNVVPTGIRGAIWMAGASPSMDAGGNLYVMTGNGTFNPGSKDFGDSFVKLNPGLSVLDFFTPFDQATDNARDFDLGSGGPLVVPDQPGAHPHELIGCGKSKSVYVIDRDNMGHFHAGNDSQIVQALPNVVGAVSTGGFNPDDHCFMTPAFFEQNVYFIGNHDTIKAFHLDPSTGLLSTSPTSKGRFFYPFPGGQPVVSSNGSTHGIVWAVDFNSPAALHAYDATNVANELYNSNQVASRDSLGSGVKFVVPTIIKGKVYVGTRSHLVVYGLL
ncbi:MAG TPA: hypothetical protein VKZ53_17055 [Candidatus Angelobacter sp.]|nr:hypothetical protein [Candidatus Angelobacter sp.]